MNDTLKQIGSTGIVPVVVLNKVSDAVPLAEALIRGGLPCAEVTFRTDAAEDSIREIAKKFPEMFVGAGTVLTTEQVDRAIGAGAKFIVSPGLNPKVVEYCIKKGYPVTPGIMTPTELEVALGFGLDVVKFFPAENAQLYDSVIHGGNTNLLALPAKVEPLQVLKHLHDVRHTSFQLSNALVPLPKLLLFPRCILFKRGDVLSNIRANIAEIRPRHTSTSCRFLYFIYSTRRPKVLLVFQGFLY